MYISIYIHIYAPDRPRGRVMLQRRATCCTDHVMLRTSMITIYFIINANLHRLAATNCHSN